MGDQTLLIPRLCVIVPQQRLSDERLLPTLEAALQEGVEMAACAAHAAGCTAGSGIPAAHADRALSCPILSAFSFRHRLVIADAFGVDGVHLPARMVSALAEQGWRVRKGARVCASAHDAAELEAAARIGCNFAYLSPVFATRTHPERPPLGVSRFLALAQHAPLPVVALGGIDVRRRQALAWPNVAVISAALDAEDPAEAVRALLASD